MWSLLSYEPTVGEQSALPLLYEDKRGVIDPSPAKTQPAPSRRRLRKPYTLVQDTSQ